MDTERWNQAKELFKQAIELPASDRARFIQEQTDDSWTRGHVAELVGIHFDQSDFLQTPLVEQIDSGERDTEDPLIGKQVGKFKILRRIGRGGMGTVYEAHQSNPTRSAAIKVLRFDHAIDENRLKRFRHESEVLARLQHPGIAHVYESGTFDIGHGPQPWFAMELVNGQPLSVHLQYSELSRQKKLELFVRICDAVQHAHDRGVIHRDLKPANILIESTNDPTSPGRPKVVDFGVARVMNADRNVTLLTEASDIIGTLDYLSPEQVGNSPDELDHRCDVYALGVVGFEMIAGSLPHDRRGQSLAAAIARIGDEDTVSLTAVDSNCPADLELVFAKALDPDPGRRYPTVREFAEDVQRYLNEQPVVARPPSAIYRMQKFVRRNRALVLGTVATMVALVIGLVMYAMEARQATAAAQAAQYEADKANAVNSYITNDFLTKLLAAANRDGAGNPVNISEMVDRSATNVDTMFANRPLHRAAVRNEIGTIYYNIGATDKAAEQYQQALQIWESELGPRHPDTLKAVSNLGQARMVFDKSPATEALLQRAFHTRMEVLGEEHEATLRSMNNLAQFLTYLDRDDEAETLFRQALKIQRQHLGATHKTTLITAANLGSLLAKVGRPDEALELHGEIYENAKSTLGANHVTTLSAGFHYVQSLDRVGQYERAIAVMKPILDGYQQNASTSQNESILPHRLMGKVYANHGDWELARKHQQHALRLAESQQPPPDGTIRRIKRDLRRIERGELESNQTEISGENKDPKQDR